MEKKLYNELLKLIAPIEITDNFKLVEIIEKGNKYNALF